MSEKVENTTNSADVLKWLIIAALLGGLVVANGMYDNISVLYRAIAAVVVIAAAGGIAITTEKGQGFIEFAKESKIEIRKVVWPTRPEAVQTTLIVLAATVVVGLILWGLDGIIVRLVAFITGIGV